MLTLAQIVQQYPENLRPFKRGILREYLQYKILEIIFASQYARKLVFLGGLLYGSYMAIPVSQKIWTSTILI